MIITCPDCKARYNVKDNLIPEKGKNVRCKKCKTAFRAYTDGTSRRLKEKAKPAEPAQANLASGSIGLDSNLGMVHSTVRVDASAIQEAMKKQFPGFDESANSVAAPEEPFTGSLETEQATHQAESTNEQDFNEFAMPGTSEENQDQAIPGTEATNDEPVTSSFSESVPDDIDQGLDNALASQSQSAFDSEMGGNNESEEEDPFSDVDEPFADHSSEVEEKDPLTDTGNFGFDIDQGNETSIDDESEEAPSLFDEPAEPETPFSMETEIPDSQPETFESMEPVIKVPDEDEVPSVGGENLFDLSIDGTVYQNINLGTVERWIKEGRLLEKDRVSPGGLDQFETADSYPELSAIYKSYFKAETRGQDESHEEKKKGFFARLFGR